MTAIYFLLVSFAAALTFFSLYQLFFFIVSIFAPARKETGLDPERLNSFAFIIPAHNEQLLIEGLIRSIYASDYPKTHFEVMVIADNCTDRTARISAGLGARCYARFDTGRRGKPHALNWLISQIDLSRHDAYIIVDADTVIDRHFLRAMNRCLNRGSKAIQGYYGVMNPDESWLTRLSILPGILKFRLHHPGKRLFGLSCPLAGNGMCFSAEIFKKYGWNAFSLTENWEYYVMLSLNEYLVDSAEDAVIYSQVARSLKLGKDQRARWFKGRIETMLRYLKPLLGLDGSKVRVKKLDTLIELVHPSYSMLFLFTMAALGLSLLYVKAFGAGHHLAYWLSAILLGQTVFFLSGLIVQRASLKTWLSLFMVPPYLAWKFLITSKAILNFRDKKWTKTTRNEL